VRDTYSALGRSEKCTAVGKAEGKRLFGRHNLSVGSFFLDILSFVCIICFHGYDTYNFG
jgi:hypothetical protein